jgi:hypothetical protein
MPAPQIRLGVFIFFPGKLVSGGISKIIKYADIFPELSQFQSEFHPNYRSNNCAILKLTKFPLFTQPIAVLSNFSLRFGCFGRISNMNSQSRCLYRQICCPYFMILMRARRANETSMKVYFNFERPSMHINKTLMVFLMTHCSPYDFHFDCLRMIK